MKIPKQFRVTLQYRDDHEYDEKWNVTKVIKTRLGFANVYEPNNKAYVKRQFTQDLWAYGCKWFHSAHEPSFLYKDDKVYKRERLVKDGLYVMPFEYVETIVPEELQPIIIDNEPLEGFRIQKSVNRLSTSNKVWRILDPRGFELEVSTDNMEDIIMAGDISQGLIVGKCVWAGPKTLLRV